MKSWKSAQEDHAENKILTLTVAMVPGDRESQQDNYGYCLRDQEALVTVCDGMGGNAEGRNASLTAVSGIIDRYEAWSRGSDIQEFLQTLTRDADREVSAIMGKDGMPAHAGTTMVTVLCLGSCFYWNSVGDSRIYLMRGNEFVQVTKDQNYETVLIEQLRSGLIDRETYQKELAYGQALISYLGLGEVDLIDYNRIPLRLQHGDRILMMTDGLYRLLPDAEIAAVLQDGGNDRQILDLLEQRAAQAAKHANVKRDNMTAVLMRIK